MQDGLGSEQAGMALVEDSYEILPGRPRAGQNCGAPPGLILLCDHAGNAFPPGYGTLGLPPAELERHIAYDIGAAGIVRAMSKQLGAPAVLSRYSRLLIDPNRGADDPTLIMRLSDGAIVPGNHHIDQTEWDKRVRLYYEPYHAAVSSLIAHMRRKGVTPVIVSIHSFTQAWKGVARPWHAGILWDRDDRLSSRLIETLRADPATVVGDNEPYSGQLEGDCLYRHATSHGLAHALIEVRQDLIGTAQGQQHWAERLSKGLEAIWADPGFAALVKPIPPLRLRHATPHMLEQNSRQVYQQRLTSSS